MYKLHTNIRFLDFALLAVLLSQSFIGRHKPSHRPRYHFSVNVDRHSDVCQRSDLLCSNSCKVAIFLMSSSGVDYTKYKNTRQMISL